MYIVKFERQDNQPDEEYLYHNLCDALVHFELFRNDNSGLYRCISVIEFRENHETIVVKKEFEKTYKSIAFWVCRC